MKDIIVIFIILIFIIGGSIGTGKFYENTMNEFNEKLDSLISMIDIDINKELTIKEIEELWKEKENVLIVFQDHDSIDNIEEAIYECLHYYKANQIEYLKLSKEKVIRNIEDLVKREKLTLVNLF